MTRNIVVAITGASGAVYAVRLLDVLVAAGCEIQLTISPAGVAVLKQELGLEVDLAKFDLSTLLPTKSLLASRAEFAPLQTQVGADAWHTERLPSGSNQVLYHHHQNFFAAIASGSALTDGMVVCPCSGGTLSAIANGASGNLIHRAADVHLKEHRRLVLVPREAPLSIIQIDNMRKCAEAGAIILPAAPGFYHGVQTIRDLVDFVVGRICDQLGVRTNLLRRWGDPASHDRGTP